MTLEEINSLLEPYLAPDSLSPEQSQQVQAHLELLLKWNAKINLTAIRSGKEIVQRHFGESLFAARMIAKTAPKLTSAADIGSGAGFPGLPLKIWLPQIKLALVESNGKKVAFLREVIRALGLKDIEVVAARAESLRATYELVTFRAVERFENVLPIASRLIQPNCLIALLVGEAQVAVAHNALQNLSWDAPTPVPLSENKVLLLGRKLKAQQAELFHVEH